MIEDSYKKHIDLFKHLKEDEANRAYKDEVLDNIAVNLTKNLEASRNGISKTSVEKIVNVSLKGKSKAENIT